MNQRSMTAMLLAYVIPGAGHFYLGYRAKAAAFAAIILVLFILGVSIDGSLYTLGDPNGGLLGLLATIGSMGSGALYFFGRAAGPSGDITSITFEYGRMFTLTAGLMNLLLVLDCFDIVAGRKGEE